MSTLYDKVRSSENLFSAWRHLRRSALNSDNKDIRGRASEFEHRHHARIKQIQTELRENRFLFDEAQGILKDRRKRQAAGKDPRPITVGTIRNRLVQRAILQVLQPRKISNPANPRSKPEIIKTKDLGKLDAVNRSRYGVGGLIAPYGGVKPAIESIMRAMDEGAKYYFQSDIKSFFTQIPVEKVVRIVLEETKDKKLADLFRDGLQVHLSNKEELAGYAKLFPANGIGVAQGSSLSAFAGNVLLYDHDHELNSMGVTAIRYIDDIIILGDTQAALDASISHCKNRLSEFRFSLYRPAPGSDKASQGTCKSGINFLGCELRPKKCSPSRASTKGLQEDIRTILSESKSAIKSIRNGRNGFKSKFSKSSTLDRIGKKIYGWQKSIAFSTEEQPFKDLDNKISEMILRYDYEVARIISKFDPTSKCEALGIPNTHKMFLAISK